MVSSEDKTKILQDISQMVQNQMNALDIQLELHKFLLRDTGDGKLYKYRTFDKDGFSIQNLKDGTLHCSTPEAFNDPFDCKMGITIESLYKAVYEKELDVVCTIFEKYLCVAQDRLRIEDCNDVEQRVIGKLLSSEIMNNFIVENEDMGESDEKVAEIIMNNGFFITELLQIVLSEEVFNSSLGIATNMISRLLEHIDSNGMLLLSKDDATLEDFARANGVMEDDDEIGLAIRLNQKLYPMNDKAINNTQNAIDDVIHSWIDRMNTLFKIGCLCTSYKNRLMWSHYADSHKGFCIEYDYNNVDEEYLSLLPLPVVYSDIRPVPPWRVALGNVTEHSEEAYAQIMLGLLTKDKVWEYENEWRILINSSEVDEVKMPKISCVYLGTAIEQKNRKQIIEIAKKHNIPVKQMKVDRGACDLHAEDVFFSV